MAGRKKIHPLIKAGNRTVTFPTWLWTRLDELSEKEIYMHIGNLLHNSLLKVYPELKEKQTKIFKETKGAQK